MAGFDPSKFLAPLRPIVRLLRLVFTPLSILIIVWFIWESRTSLDEIFDQGNLRLLVAAIFLWVATNVLSPLVTVYLFRFNQMEISWRNSTSIHCKRLPAKYLPGGIWHSVGRASDYSALGYSGKKIGFYFFVENFLLVAVTLCLSAGIVDHLISVPVVNRIVYFLPVLLGVAILLLPYAVKLLLPDNSLSIIAYFISVILLFLYWCMVGLTFACYISAFTGLGLANSLSELAGIYIFSWSLGYLAIFAPQGIGVAEFIAGNLLTSGNQAGQILALLVGFRVLVLFADLVSWLLLGWWKVKQK